MAIPYHSRTITILLLRNVVLNAIKKQRKYHVSFDKCRSFVDR